MKKIIIIGAGTSGLTIANQLNKYFEVVVLEKNTKKKYPIIYRIPLLIGLLFNDSRYILKRSIKTAYLSNSTEPIGAIISYHGSLGLSFNFLENRCILILDASLSDKEKYFVTCSLINSIVDLYADFPLGYIPVLTDDSAAKSLILQGHPLDRKFRHLICLRNGFVQWYQHIIHIFTLHPTYLKVY